MLKRILLIVSVIAAGVAGWYTKRNLMEPAELPYLKTLGGDFVLMSTLGKPAALSDFRGRVILLNFGYMNCPDVCPTVLARMRAVIDQLPDVDIDTQPIFITLDPARDTTDRLRPYVRYFGDSFIGLSGTPEQIESVSKLFKVVATKESPTGEGDYGFIHSSHIYLLDTHGNVRMTFDQNIPLPVMVQTVYQLIAQLE